MKQVWVKVSKTAAWQGMSSNTWAYTRLGHIDMTQEELTELLGNGDVEITLE